MIRRSFATTVLLAGLATPAATPASAATLFCAPIAVAELIGEPGPLTISASDPALGNPTVFWVDTATGEHKEHYYGAATFFIDEGTLEIVGSGLVDRRFEALDADQRETYHIDLGYDVHPFYRTVDKALAQVGTCVSAPMGVIPAEADAPIWPFPYAPGGEDKSGG